MEKKFSRKSFEEKMEKSKRDADAFWASEKGKQKLKEAKLKPALLLASSALAFFDDFKKMTGQNYADYIIGIAEKEMQKSEMVIESMKTFAEKEGWIKPYNADELEGFFLWLYYSSDNGDVKLDRDTYRQFSKYRGMENNNIQSLPGTEYWKGLIKVELHNLLIGIEEKIKNKIGEWNQGKSKIECAAFCQLLFDNKYFVQGSTKRVTVNKFSLSRYGTDIEIQLQSKFKIDRNKHKLLLSRFFR